MKSPHILSIIGMHRSGTSMAARYFWESGLFMGHDLLGSHWSNPAGHFEDKEFIQIHNSILRSHSTDFAVTSHIDWNFDEGVVSRAKEILEARSSLTQWGWKDPRTTLFLPLWKKLIPDCHFVIVYRDYLPVVRSLISRDIIMDRTKTNRWQRILNPRFTPKVVNDLFNKYLRSWIWYNKEIISQIIEDPHVKYLIVSYDQLAQGDFSILDDLKNNGFILRPPVHFNKLSLRAKFIKNIPATGDQALIAEADAIYKYLNAL